MRRIPALAAALTLALTACAGGSTQIPEPDEDGMISFGCALAADSHDWDEGLSADSDEAIVPLPLGVSVIFGSQTATPMAGYEDFEMLGQDLAKASSALDVESTNDLLTDVVEQCDEQGVSYEDIPTDKDAIAEFSCSLVDMAVSSDTPIEDWLLPAQEDNIEINAIAAAGMFLATKELKESDAYSQFYDDAIGVVEATSTLQPELIETHMEAIDSMCEE